MAQDTQEVGEVQVSLKQILKEANGTSIVLIDHKETTEKLYELVKKYDEIQEVTAENFEEAKKARLDVREHRFGIQNVTKKNKKYLNDAKNLIVKDEDELVAIISPTEERLDKGIKEIENAKEKAKEEKERVERERIAGISKLIAEYTTKLNTISTVGMFKNDLDEFDIVLEQLKTDVSNDAFQEFSYEGTDLVSKSSNLRELIVNRINEQSRLEEEKKAQELESQRLQKIEAEQKEREQQLLARENELKRQEEERHEKIRLEREAQECRLNEALAVRVEQLSLLGFESDGIEIKSTSILYTLPLNELKTMDIDSFKSFVDGYNQEVTRIETEKQASIAHQNMVKEIHDTCVGPITSIDESLFRILLNEEMINAGKTNTNIKLSFDTFTMEIATAVSKLKESLLITA